MVAYKIQASMLQANEALGTVNAGLLQIYLRTFIRFHFLLAIQLHRKDAWIVL